MPVTGSEGQANRNTQKHDAYLTDNVATIRLVDATSQRDGVKE